MSPSAALIFNELFRAGGAGGRIMNVQFAISRVNKNGMLLVFPDGNKADPASLWSEFYPRSKMRWVWDAGGDGRVAELWHLREQLSRSGKAVYGKWHRGRATLISLALFPALVRALNPDLPRLTGLSRAARDVLDVLEEDSPLSTKALKRACDLTGRDNEAAYARALKELWERGAIAAFGEVDEGAFPSIAVGATSRLFEDEWEAARRLSDADADAQVERALASKPAFLKFYRRLRARSQTKSI